MLSQSVNEKCKQQVKRPAKWIYFIFFTSLSVLADNEMSSYIQGGPEKMEWDTFHNTRMQ